MTERMAPRPRDFVDLLKFRRPSLDRTAARLARAHTIGDLRDIARRVTPKAPFDYTDGAAEAELSLARARQAYEDIEFHPSILRDVSTVDTSCIVTGGPSSMPFGIAPTGFTRMMHTAGERAGAAAAGAAGIPFSLSTVGTTTPEGVAEANPDGRNWFQLYMWKDRDRSTDVMKRAAASGFDTLLVTVDVPVAGARLRDRYNGLTIPPTLTGRTVLNAIPRVRWWFDFLSTEPIASRPSTIGTARWRNYSTRCSIRPSISTTSCGSWTSGPVGWSQRGCRPSAMPSAAPTWASTGSCCRTTADASSIARRCRSICCRTSCEKSATTSRSWSTPASCPARRGRRGRTWGEVHSGRARLPLRPDGRWPRRCRPSDRDPLRGARPDDEAARRPFAR